MLLRADVGFTPGVELTVNISSDRPGAVGGTHRVGNMEKLEGYLIPDDTII